MRYQSRLGTKVVDENGRLALTESNSDVDILVSGALAQSEIQSQGILDPSHQEHHGSLNLGTTMYLGIQVARKAGIREVIVSSWSIGNGDDLSRIAVNQGNRRLWVSCSMGLLECRLQ